ncbi:MAG: UDP-glucose 4-epimerase GalE [Pirellulales bacterium]|nr:UDP-glucose 4-epimerase GalE [Pirellulales bacterium]
MNVLVTGGAGYVGSFTVRALMLTGHSVWIYDNLSLGHRGAVPGDRLIEGELHDRQHLIATLRDKRIDAVMHFAALAQVGESLQDPARYYDNNVVGTLCLLEAMRDADVQRIVFSSTAAVYGIPQSVPIPEDAPRVPINPYGITKRAMEQAMEAYTRAYGMGAAALRYFNAAGASAEGDLGEDHDPESHLIPLVLQVALGKREHVVIHGDDYPTEDGTCIRDYIHVDDLASAHIAALDAIRLGTLKTMNLGTGQGASVLEIVEACRGVTGHPIPAVVGGRRIGDPPSLVADANLARTTLRWNPQYTTIESIVESAWKWHHSNPNGYGD